VHDAAPDPELPNESLRVRERLAADDLADARRRAGQGHQLADLVHDGRE
jgi:hypothetical protein